MAFTVEQLKALEQVAVQASRAGAALIRQRQEIGFTQRFKAGMESQAASIVTEVDIMVEALLLDHLQPAMDQFDLALLTEERPDDGSRLKASAFWCIDPIDGTLCFAQNRPGYSISIGLVRQSGEPLIGVVCEPISGVVYSAVKGGVICQNGKPMEVAISKDPHIIYVDGSFHQHDDFEQVVRSYAQTFESVPKIVHDQGAVMNAVGTFQNPGALYFKYPKPQKGGGSLWDYAATACLMQVAGGIATDIHGGRLQLNNAETTFMNHGGVVYTMNPEKAKFAMGCFKNYVSS